MTPPGKDKPKEKPITAVMEDYLEAIFDINQFKRTVRVKDIASRLDVKMPTVCSMLRTLRDRGMVDYEKHEYVELTPDGEDIGKEMRRRHGVLLEFLTAILKIDPETADREACLMEHGLSAATLDRLIQFMEFIQACPRTGESWLHYFEDFRRHGKRPELCRTRCDDFTGELKDQIEKMEPLES